LPITETGKKNEREKLHNNKGNSGYKLVNKVIKLSLDHYNLKILKKIKIIF
jgi:hypothetical protein